ncbi:EF-hand, partial [Mycena galopus ATCC 62051]
GSGTSTPEDGHGGSPYSAACDDSGGFVKPTPSWRAPAGADPQLCLWFSRVDADGSGEITVEELQSALVNSNMTRFDIRTVRTLMTLFDTDDSGTIDFNEFAGLWTFIQNWKKVFELFDPDRSGMIDKEELHKVLLAKFRRDLSPNLITSNTADSDAPAGFSLDSFLRAVVFVKQLGEEFQQAGPDGNGLIRINSDKFIEIALHLL